MNPLRITADNYRSFAELDLTLPTGCIAVLGENGAGKSSIVNAIDLALFGPPSRNLGDYLSEDAFDAELVLCLEFEHRGELYRVRRGYSPKGRGKTTLDFERWADETIDGSGLGDHWTPATRETAAATQEAICEILGLSRETFRASAFLAQGDGAAFTEAQPRERKAILAEVLGLDIWDRLLELAKTDRRRLEDTGHRLTTELARSREELATRPSLEARRSELGKDAEALQEELARLEARKTDVQQQLATAREKAVELRGLQDVLAERSRALTKAGASLAQISAHEADARPNPAQRERFTRLAGALPELEQEYTEAIAEAEARKEHERLSAERKRFFGEASELRMKAHELRFLAQTVAPGESTCDRCGQLLGAEAAAASVKSYQEEAEKLVAQALLKDEAATALPVESAGERLETLGGAREIADITNALTEARQAQKRLAEIEAQLARAEAMAESAAKIRAQIPELEAAVAEAKAKVEGKTVPDEVQLVRAVGVVESQIITARPALDRTRQELAVAEAELKRLEEIAHQVGGSERMIAELQAELDIVLLAERAYGRDGIPALILENAAIPQIEVEANRILAELGTSFSVELHTQRELRGGGVAEALDIVVAGETGGTRPYETFSGGERTRLNLALRIALARLLAHRRGAEVRLLVIDEPEFLDEAGVARLAEVLRGLSPDFERIFLISHQPALREAFDEVLTVVKDGDRSRVEEAVEPVEALA